MRKLFGGLVLTAVALSLPVAAIAQRHASASSVSPKNEFGVDLGLAFGQIGSGCTTSCGTFEAGTPVDLRVGFPAGAMSVEPRVSLSYLSENGGHLLVFSPDVNLLKPMGTNTARHGLYLTGGLGLNVISASGASSENQFSLNGGVGTRIPIESAAWRIEGFFKYDFHSGALPSGWNLGGRFGMSFWK
ncbi:MAG TPA: hypothetical protein VG454_05925 [Gemmatimonadales bacterium]|nr:hypothetical protein [Gemmatimonadales bacterium]